MKLSVGSGSADDLARWQRSALFQRGRTYAPFHDTRMFPRRADEILRGGSIYWVIAGYFAVRQRVTGLEPVTAGNGTRKCRILLDPALEPVMPVPRRPFQGWRYLKPSDAPEDSEVSGTDGQRLQRALSDLGLL